MERREDRDKIKTQKTLLFGESLLKQGLITQEQLDEALEIQKRKKKMLGEILVEKGFINEEMLGEALAREYLLSFVDLSKEEIDEKLVKMFSSVLLKKYHFFP